MNPLTDPNTAVLIAAAIVTFGYAVSCAVWPFKPCRRCDGRGHFRSSFLNAVRLCRPCHGSGLRLRVGRKAWNTYRRLHRNSRRGTATQAHSNDDRR